VKVDENNKQSSITMNDSSTFSSSSYRGGRVEELEKGEAMVEEEVTTLR
jgi:hypothetical protein